ncbi:MCE family protein [Mycobacterium sp. AZCC_0083]|uniref:MCE family protein n=1 Tax=Mycobacterium sp. AZCC_0083 TaxID=2735882 RepID=UPI00160F2D5F|nr:MCE family protein [Mycobacterium sp. AZCC_0083]MBB5163333.1 phospholipid/cholesterol/gamma-HCH transport system substrate-binding protein [Mycobacterium sp. AZCC_0083]
MTAPGQVQLPVNTPKTPPYKLAGLVLLVITAVIVALVWGEFRGTFAKPEKLTMLSARSGLSMDPGSKVTYNGVEIGHVATVEAVDVGGVPKARVMLDVDKKFVHLIPQNVDAEIKATTVFGNKYVAFSSPKDPSAARIKSADVIDVSTVTTEFNTLFETVVSVAEKVDPVKLNQTLTATAQALDGLGNRFGQSIENGNAILADVNPLMPRIREDNQRLADLAEVYSNAAPDLFDSLEHAVTTARTLNDQRGNLDQALMSSVGFGNTGGEVFERSGPYLVRGAADLVTTSALLDEYSPSLFCTIRNLHDAEPKIASSLGGNGYSLRTHSEILGAPNPYVYPDNLPRVNAHGGPEGQPGCWQPVTRDLWPGPYLVMDTGASVAPYNHLGLGQPLAIEYVWGRQIGENTINP